MRGDTLYEYYVAGPFFNEQQRIIIEMIEAEMHKAHLKCFSPSRDAGVLDPKDLANSSQSIFSNNAQALRSSKRIIAVLEYAMDNGMTMELWRRDLGVISKAPIRIPDTGTVWEMGFGHALSIPVYGFLRDEDALSSLNVMLAKGVTGIIVGYDDLAKFLLGDEGVVKQWAKAQI